MAALHKQGPCAPGRHADTVIELSQREERCSSATSWRNCGSIAFSGGPRCSDLSADDLFSNSIEGTTARNSDQVEWCGANLKIRMDCDRSRRRWVVAAGGLL